MVELDDIRQLLLEIEEEVSENRLNYDELTDLYVQLEEILESCKK